jgi:hypothetical protein
MYVRPDGKRARIHGGWCGRGAFPGSDWPSTRKRRDRVSTVAATNEICAIWRRMSMVDLGSAIANA